MSSTFIVTGFFSICRSAFLYVERKHSIWGENCFVTHEFHIFTCYLTNFICDSKIMLHANWTFSLMNKNAHIRNVRFHMNYIRSHVIACISHVKTITHLLHFISAGTCLYKLLKWIMDKRGTCDMLWSRVHHNDNNKSIDWLHRLSWQSQQTNKDLLLLASDLYVMQLLYNQYKMLCKAHLRTRNPEFGLTQSFFVQAAWRFTGWVQIFISSDNGSKTVIPQGSCSCLSVRWPEPCLTRA